MYSIKHCEKQLPLKWSSFEKEVIINEFYFETSDLEFEVAYLRYSKFRANVHAKRMK